MIPHTFRHTCPTDLEEAYGQLQEPDALPLAGGTDLIVNLRERRARPALLVDLKHCPELRGIEMRGDDLWIGACTTINEIRQSSQIRSALPVLTDAASRFACHELRNRATIGGNLANAAPCAQFGPPAVVTDAVFEIGSAHGTRIITAHDFFRGVNQTDLQRGELLTGIRFPVPNEPSCSASGKLSRTKGMDLPSVSMAILVLNPSRAEFREVRIAVGSVAPVPLRMYRTESILSGVPLSPDVMSAARQMMDQEIKPRASSLRAAPETKRAALAALLQEFFTTFGLLAGTEGGQR